MQTKTTFNNDFAIAERFGIDAVKETYNRAFNEWKNNVEYITELTLVLNWRLGVHYAKHNMPLAYVYEDLWKQNDMWCRNNLHGEDRAYYLRTTD